MIRLTVLYLGSSTVTPQRPDSVTKTNTLHLTDLCKDRAVHRFNNTTCLILPFSISVSSSV